MTGTPFSKEEQRDLASIPAGVGSRSWSWAQRPGQERTAQKFGCSFWADGILNRGGKRHIWSPRDLPELCSPSPLVLGCGAHYRQTRELILQNHFIPWTKSALCDWAWNWGTRGTTQWSKVTKTGKAKQQRSQLHSPSPPHPTHHCYSDGRICLLGMALGLHRFGAPLPTLFPCGVGHLGPGWPLPGGGNHLPREHHPWWSEKPEKY